MTEIINQLIDILKNGPMATKMMASKLGVSTTAINQVIYNKPDLFVRIHESPAVWRLNNELVQGSTTHAFVMNTNSPIDDQYTVHRYKDGGIITLTWDVSKLISKSKDVRIILDSNPSLDPLASILKNENVTVIRL